MNKPFSEIRKIDPTKSQFLADGTLNDNNRIEIGKFNKNARVSP